jgi:hypothetical protein
MRWGPSGLGKLSIPALISVCSVLIVLLIISDNLLTRVLALHKKQRSNVIPGSSAKSPGPFSFYDTPSNSPRLGFVPRQLAFEPLNFSRESMSPVADDGFQSATVETSDTSLESQSPRYAELLQEAIAINSDNNSPDEMPVSDSVSESDDGEQDESDYRDHTPEPEPVLKGRQSLGMQLKGLLWSYLPKASKAVPQPPTRKNQSSRPGLPLPPKEILEKPRGPVTTPVRRRAPRPAHPKELVHLQPAPPPKPTMIPRVSKKPQRLVELHPLPPPPPVVKPVEIPRPRRSSGASVKDLVKNFEQQAAQTKSSRLKTVQSFGDLNKGNRKEFNKPIWKP